MDQQQAFQREGKREEGSGDSGRGRGLTAPRPTDSQSEQQTPKPFHFLHLPLNDVWVCFFSPRLRLFPGAPLHHSAIAASRLIYFPVHVGNIQGGTLATNVVLACLRLIFCVCVCICVCRHNTKKHTNTQFDLARY